MTCSDERWLGARKSVRSSPVDCRDGEVVTGSRLELNQGSGLEKRWSSLEREPKPMQVLPSRYGVTRVGMAEVALPPVESRCLRCCLPTRPPHQISVSICW